MSRIKFKTTDEYIASFPKDVQQILEKIRGIFRKHAKDATEAISYDMIGFRLNGNWMNVAGWKEHIALYGISSEVYGKNLEKYLRLQGTYKFPLKEPIPYDEIEEAIKYRIEELKKSVSL